MNMIQRLSMVLTVLTSLIAGTTGRVHAGDSTASALKPADVFNVYSLQDFCLDLRDQLTAGDASSMTKHLNTDRIFQALSFPESILPHKEPGSAPSEFRRMLEANLINRLVANLGTHKAVWMMTRFQSEGENSAQCTLTNDSYIEQDHVFYALRLQLSRLAGRIVVVDAQDSLFDQPYSHMLGAFFGSLMSEIDPVTDSAPLSTEKPAGAFVKAVKSRNHRQVVALYENRLSSAHQSQAIFQQRYLEAKIALDDDYSRALALVISRQPADLASGYRLDLAYLQQNPVAVPPLLDLLEQTWGYHPGMDVLRLRAYQDVGNMEKVYQTFHHALEKNDGYSLTYWHMMRFLASQQRFAQAILLADILVKRFDYRLESKTLGKDEYLRDFAKSALFREWLKKQQQSPG